jgi:sporulation protein YlmC with PRC-barrel domain
MKRSIKNLKQYTTETINGETGAVTEFYFDDETLTVRYLLVETGDWPFRRKALIPIEAIERFDWEKKLFPVTLTLELILTSPEIDTTKPISRQQENELLNHYLGHNYWDTGNYSVDVLESPGSPGNGPGTKKISGSPPIRSHKNEIRLRSTQEVTGYNVYGVDGEVGVVDDFIVNDYNWKLHSMVVDTDRLLPGKKVMVSPQCIHEINWEHSKVFVKMFEIAIRNSPGYHPVGDTVMEDKSPG